MNPVTQAASVVSTRGFVILAVVVFGILFVAAFADVWLIFFGRARANEQPAPSSDATGTTGTRVVPSVGDYMNAFVKTRPWVAVAMAIVFGAMITHFFIYIDHG
jgi:hypothetical protein